MTFGENDAKEMNLGVGYRQLFADPDLIVGANLYYDSRWTVYGNQFDQYGVGVELLTEWVDARANVYLAEDDVKLADDYPVDTVTSRTTGDDPYATGTTIYQHQRHITTTTTHIFEKYEQARDGFDAEVGVKLPYVDQWTEVRVFGGYYRWDSAFNETESVDGFKARVEVRALPILYIDAAYVEDKDLEGQQWTAGVRVNLPFDLANLANGKNPFEGSLDRAKADKEPFSARLTEQVMRDLKVRMAEPEYVENPHRKTSHSTSHSWEQPLLSDIIFVDQDRGDDANPGTFEAPKETINGGVAVTGATRGYNVYVDSAEGAGGTTVSGIGPTGIYSENVLVPDNVNVYGSGTRIYGISGRYFGTDTAPIVEGAGFGAVFTLGNHTTLAGFEIHYADPAVQGYVDGGGVGVYGPAIQSVLLRDLTVVGMPNEGILLQGTAGQDFSATLQNVNAEGCGGWGTVIDAGSVFSDVPQLGGVCSIAVSGSAFDYNEGGGLLVQVGGYDDINVTLSDIEANGNGRLIGPPGNLHSVGDGIVVEAVAASGDATITATGIDVWYNEEDGMALRASTGLGFWPVFKARNLSYLPPPYLPPVSGGDVTITVADVRANGNGYNGVGVSASAGGVDVTASAGGDDSRAVVQISDVQACGNGSSYYGNGINVNATAGGALLRLDGADYGTVVIDIHDVQTSGNWGDGVWTAAMAGSETSVTIHDVEANFNGYEYDGYCYGDGVFVATECLQGDATVSLSDITANNNADSGVRVIGGLRATVKGESGPVPSLSGDITVTVTDSTMTYNGYYGLELGVRGFNPDFAASEASVTVSGCSLYGNDEYDLYNDGDPVNAAYNWWGQNANPSAQIGGPGTVTFIPWLSDLP